MKLIFSGDAVIKNIEDFSLSSSLIDIIKSHDFGVINFEGTLKGDSPFTISKIGQNIHNCNESIAKLKEHGFSIFTLANNHMLDFGTTSFLETIQELGNHNILHTGAGTNFDSAYKPLIIEKKDEKIAIINCCHAEFGVYKYKNIPVKAGYAWINSTEIERQIISCKKNGCFVIVIPHAGVEFQSVPLPEWRDIYKHFIDIGADAVIGGHPHTIQGKEVYKDKNIYYSLGNFCFRNESKLSDENWNSGLIVSLDTVSGNYNEYFIEYDGKTVKLSSNENLKSIFTERSNILYNEAEYYKQINEIITELWNSTYKDLYDSVPNFINCRNHFIKNLLKYFAKKYIFRSRFQKDLNETLLLHNIQIESHRYAVERYLYLRNCEKNNLLRN